MSLTRSLRAARGWKPDRLFPTLFIRRIRNLRFTAFGAVHQVFVFSACLLAMGLSACGDSRPVPGSATLPVLKAHLYKTLTGHSGQGREVAFSSDSQVLATSSVDGTAKIWKLPEGQMMRTLVHPGGVTSVSFSPDGQTVATGGYDGTVRLWDTKGGTHRRTLSGQGGTIWAVAMSPHGENIASSGEDKTVKLWRLSDGALLRTFSGHTLNVWSVEFSPDGKLLASGSFDKTAKLWDVGTGALVRTLTGHSEAIVHLAFNPDGTMLATGSDDSSIRLWRIHDGTLIRTLTDGTDHVYTVSFSADGLWLATGGRGQGALSTLWKEIVGPGWSANGATVRLWRVSDGTLQQVLSEHSGDVWSVALSPDGKWLATSSEDKTVKLWRLGDGVSLAAQIPTDSSFTQISGKPHSRIKPTGGGI